MFICNFSVDKQLLTHAKSKKLTTWIYSILLLKHIQNIAKLQLNNFYLHFFLPSSCYHCFAKISPTLFTCKSQLPPPPTKKGNEKVILTMIGSESHPMSFKNLRHTFYTNTTKVSCVQRESNNESSPEKVFRLQSL